MLCVIKSQEVITGLQENTLIIKALKDNKPITHKNNLYLHLPFIEDFSYQGPFPDDSLWEDKYVFINNNYSAFPPTMGVATFDALNDSGRIYYYASSFPFIADYLTSKPIQLDSVIIGGLPVAIKISDSLYFSFFYQPQGIGDAPDIDDSLTLQFYSPADSTWRTVWSTAGSDLQTFKNLNKTYFKQILIPITDSVLYYKKGFKFRFFNYASIGNNNLPGWCGNVDQWNIDYIYLNIGRSMADTLYRDITFVSEPPSMLKYYQAMPWEQYNVSPTSSMLDSISLLISNLSDITYNYQYLYNVTDTNFSLIHSYNGGAFNLIPYYINGYQNYLPHSTPPVNFTFPIMAGATDYIITHILNPSAPADIRKQNDTLRFRQKFRNYYAYDDGTAEAGYGLSIANGKVAYKFTLNKPDTLRGINVFFNRTFDNSNAQYFKLKVWSSINPENVIYESPLIKPVFTEGFNNFHTYFINDEIILTGTFYIGFEQTNANNLNIGFDRNTRGDYNMFYNVDGNWYNTMYKGSLMMRPILGNKIYYANVYDFQYNTNDNNQLILFPNPVNGGILNINTISNVNYDKAIINIFSITGRLITTTKYSNKINVSNLPSGLYIISLYDNKNIVTGKFVVE